MSKIIIIGPAFPLRGGIANFNEALCRTMNEMGHDASIVSFSLQYPGFLFPGTTQMAEGDGAPEHVPVVTMVNSINPLSWIRTARYIRSQKPDIVIIRYWLPFMAPCLGTIARWVKRSAPAPSVIAIADNIVPHENRAGDRKLTGYFLRTCDAVLVMSQSVLNDLRSFDQHMPATIQPHPVYDIFGEGISKSEARKKLNADENEKWILFFGFVRHYKGLDLLLKAMSDERIKALGVKLMVAGEFYDDKQPYLELIRMASLENSVVLHDRYIPREAVKFYFCGADLVVQPYRDATQSGVTQIAYHFNKPMVVTNVGGLPEMVPDRVAGYVTATDPKAIADAIIDFYEHSREALLIEGVRETAGKYSWKAMVESLLRLAKKDGK